MNHRNALLTPILLLAACYLPAQDVEILARAEIRANSNANQATLELIETADDAARLAFKSTVLPGKEWKFIGHTESSASDALMSLNYSGQGALLSINGEGDVEIADHLTINGATTAIGVINAHFGIITHGVSYFTEILSMQDNRIANVADPTSDQDAVNKQYLEAYVAEQTGLFPRALSLESAALMDFPTCALYCFNLVEGGYEDWGIPSAEQLSYFAGQTGDASTLWTSTPVYGESAWAWAYGHSVSNGFDNGISSTHQKIIMRLHSGQNETAYFSDPAHKCRCVR